MPRARTTVAVLLAAMAVVTVGRVDEAHAKPEEPERKKERWYDRIHVRGYTQVRYNGLIQTNDALVNDQGDKSLGGDGGFFVRRARLVLSGDVHPRVSIYLQPDFANLVGDNTHVVAMRDWYADVFLDDQKEARIRVGQSKIPYGFENMQSSSNRLPFDRSDPINSAFANERDLGVFFYWAPKAIRARFKELVDSGLKGSGDYGVIGLGVFNGQTANKKEANANRHVIARVAYPFRVGSQILELGAGGYAGKYVVAKDDTWAGPTEHRDVRAHASVVLYPKPFGFQAEYNTGLGPELDLAARTIREQRLHGGYAMVMAKLGDFIPYVRAARYDGGKKHEKNAPSYRVRELNVGVEWQPWKALELTAELLIAERTHPKTFEQVHGTTLRLQAQINY